MVTRRVYFLIWPIRGCTSGQSIARVEDQAELDTLDTNKPLLKSIQFPLIVISILHHSNKDTRRVQAFLVRSYNRFTHHVVHRSCLTRRRRRSNSGFHILANLIKRGLERFKMFTANKKKNFNSGKPSNHNRNVNTKSN